MTPEETTRMQKYHSLKAEIQDLLTSRGLQNAPSSWAGRQWSLHGGYQDQPWCVWLSYPATLGDDVIDQDVEAAKTLPVLADARVSGGASTLMTPVLPHTTYIPPMPEGTWVGPIEGVPEHHLYHHVPRKVRRLTLSPR